MAQTTVDITGPGTDDNASQNPRDTRTAPRDAHQSVRVLYIGGQLRSGSTLLGRLMGELDGFANVGEVVYLFDPYLQNRLCGCGTPLRECEFWNSVIEEAFGGYDKLDTQAILASKRSLERLRTAPRLILFGGTGRVRQQMQEYVQVLDSLYKAIQKVSGARVLVDTSKSTIYAYMLQQAPSVDLKLVHLLRDSRAVAYSFQRSKLNPAVHWKQQRIGTAPAARVAAVWAAQNALMRLLRPGQRDFLLMRYEDAVQAPRATIEEICRLAGEPLPDKDFLSTPTVSLGVHHTATGNPNRFAQEVTITPDMEWREKMALRDRAIVTGLTFPLLLFYGYGWNGARRQHAKLAR